MSNKFKQQAAQQRAAVPQIDLESAKPVMPQVTESPEPPAAQPYVPIERAAPVQTTETTVQRPKLALVDTKETPTNRGFSMYPSRHRQVAKDLAYIEDRNPWEIIEDALEEYVIKHYGKEYKRK